MGINMGFKNLIGNKISTDHVLQDLGILFLVICLFVASVITATAPESSTVVYIIMLIGLFLVVLLAAYKVNYLATVCTGFEVLVFLVYKIYNATSYGTSIILTDYVWLFLPMLVLGSMLLFLRANTSIELANDLLREQVDELVMINPLTGLYNLRSMYNDLERDMAYASRHDLPISLLVMRLRYEPELRSILSKSSYEQLLQRLAGIVEDLLRREDKVYSIDSSGAIGVILTCDKAGIEAVIARIRSNVSAKDAFAGITDKPIKVEVCFGACQYDKNTIHNAMEFKLRAEGEMQYDV